MMKRLMAFLLLIGGFAGVATAQDMMDLGSAQIVRAPADVGSWLATVQITALSIAESGIAIQTAAPIAWPDTPNFSTPQCPDCMGPLQYTVWLCVTPARWQCGGMIQMWQGRGTDALPPLPSQWSLWFGPSAGGATGGEFGDYVPKPGDTIGLFIAAGDERGSDNVTVVRERSNVVTFPLVDGDTQSLAFTDTPQTPAADPPVSPIPGAQPVVTWSADVDLDKLSARMSALEAQASAAAAAFSQLQAALAALTNRTSALESKRLAASCSASVFGVPIHCALTF